MANIIQRLFDTGLEERYATKLEESGELVNRLVSENMAKDIKVASLDESMTDLMRYMEDLNWMPVGGWEENKGFSLDTIKENADRLAALLTVNPTIKKAINARVGYIWSRGVSFDKLTAKNKAMLANPHNLRVLFDETAAWPLEAKLATDGNLWAITSRTTDEVILTPIEHIAGWVLDEADPSRVNYWLVEYTVNAMNFATGVPVPKHIKKFIPAAGFTGNKVNSIDDIPVDKTSEMIHVAVNRQEGWILGIPDIMAAMFWAKAHKELFESGTTYVKAQGKFASKVVSKTAAGAQNSAARIADGPRRDPISGEVLDAGGTAVMSGGLDYQLMGKMSGGVDFKAFDPVAGLVAVGLGVPLDVVLGRSDSDEKSLEQSVVDEMRLRQAVWTLFFKTVFQNQKAVVVWPKIKSEPTYRLVQALEISNKTVALSREEIRMMTLEAYGIEGDPNDLPDIEENAAYLFQKAIADNAAENAEKAAAQAQATTPEQGVDAGIGKLSNGDDQNEDRDNPSDKNVTR